MTSWATGTCRANGIIVHYLRTGGNKPPVVLLHGLMLNGACWTPLARTLEKDYDVIMPDARGHGSSSAPDHGYRYDDLADDVVSLIDALGLAAPVLLGHSMGGMTAAVAACRKPTRLRGLILADPAFLTPQRQQEVDESDIADQHRKLLNLSKEDLLTYLQARHPLRSLEVIEQFAQARMQTSMHAFKVLKPPNPDYLQLIPTLDIPSLLIIGDASAVISPAAAADLAKLNQHLKVLQIKEAGHAIPYDQPERFSSAVQIFLRSVSA